MKNNSVIYYTDAEIEKALLKDGIVLSSASGNSMYPFLKDKTRIILSKTNNINMFDTVLYKSFDKYILHRVIGIGKNIYVVKGDNCLLPESVDKDSILAVLAGFYKGNKYYEINENINKKYFNISMHNVPLIKLKQVVKRLLNI